LQHAFDFATCQQAISLVIGSEKTDIQPSQRGAAKSFSILETRARNRASASVGFLHLLRSLFRSLNFVTGFSTDVIESAVVMVI